MTNRYRVCTRCVMDTSVEDIEFNQQGVCNYCEEFVARAAHLMKGRAELQRASLDELVAKVKRSGSGRRYDCVVGVSGGADSSYTLVKVVEHGLRPLAVHMDNGWDSELAHNNIANLIRGLGVDLYTHVIDWDEYRDLMQAFFDADVIDVELLYDNAMIAVNYQQAARHRVRHMLFGTNTATEGLRMPRAWNWLKFDKKNIKALARRYGRVRISSFPAIGTAEFIWYEYVRGIRWVSFLDYLDYNKGAALEVLQEKFGFKPYPYKHYESIFTRFYQGWILPRKFGVDKRRVHLSALVVMGQMTRDEAIADLERSPYESESQLESDIDYFVKKMKWSRQDLESYVARPGKSHDEYPSERARWERLRSAYLRLSRRSRLQAQEPTSSEVVSASDDQVVF